MGRDGGGQTKGWTRLSVLPKKCWFFGQVKIKIDGLTKIKII